MLVLTSGFFSVFFCQWISQGGKVISIEPEPRNYSHLKRVLKKAREEGLIEILPVAADCISGDAKLEINPTHPGDHKLGTQGITVKAASIDEILASHHCPPVSLIKIDVQGAELRVLKGSVQTIKHNRPPLFLEIDDSALQHFGNSAQEVFTFLLENGYSVHSLCRKQISKPIAVSDALRMQERGGYSDFLFLPEGRG